MRTHQEIDECSLALHRLVAEQVMSRFVGEGMKGSGAMARDGVHCFSTYLEEWGCLIDQGGEACLTMAVEHSQKAAALRQSSPFSGVPTNWERFVFLKNWQREHEA